MTTETLPFKPSTYTPVPKLKGTRSCEGLSLRGLREPRDTQKRGTPKNRFFGGMDRIQRRRARRMAWLDGKEMPKFWTSKAKTQISKPEKKSKKNR